MPSDEEEMDLSSFPLLRIDQLSAHDTKTLLAAEDELFGLTKQSADANGLGCYAGRLLGAIQREIAGRRINALLQHEDETSGDNDGPLAIEGVANAVNGAVSVQVRQPSRQMATKKKSVELVKKKSSPAPRSEFTAGTAITSTPTKASRTTALPLSPISNQQGITTPFTAFVTTSGNTTKKTGTFRERAKAAGRSRKARMLEQSNANDQKQQVVNKQREARREQILQRMEERRQRRQKVEQARERRRNEQQKRRAQQTKKLEDEMERAAELARIDAESSGMTPEEAVASAAAAAAASLIENEGLCGIADSDSDESSTVGFVRSSRVDIPSAGGTSSIVDAGSVDNETSEHSISGSIILGADSIATLSHNNNDSKGSPGVGTSFDTVFDEGLSEQENGSPVSTADTVAEADVDSESCTSFSPSDQIDSDKPVDWKTPPSNQTTADKQAMPIRDPPVSSEADVYDGDCGSSSLPSVRNTSPPHRTPPDEQAIPRQDAWVQESCLRDVVPTCIEEAKHGDGVKSNELVGRELCIEPPKTSPPTRSFVSVYPHFWSLFTAFGREALQKGASNAGGRTMPRPTTTIDDLLKRQVNINEEFLNITADYSELETNTIVTSEQDMLPSSDLFVKIGSARPDVAILISDVLAGGRGGGGWQEFPVDVGLSDCWNLLWTWAQPKLDVDTLLISQKVNRFKGTRSLTRKDFLKKNIQRFSGTMAGKGGRRKAMDVKGIMPLTFVLPQEYNAFVAAFSAIQRASGSTSSNFWISKPIGLSRGRGISVINDIGDVSYSQPIVMQKYVMNPFLFRGYKFDLRLYVLVTAFNELEAFIYSEGFARFASKRFSASPECIYDERIHLTNSSIQNAYWDDMDSDHPVRMAKDGGGNKVKLSWLWRRLEDQGVDTEDLWKQIKELCLKTLLVVDGRITPQPNSFEIFGFDVILTEEDLEPLLIEVNACPALARDSGVDANVKEALIRDTIALVDPPAIDREALLRICRRRMGKGTGSTRKAETYNQLDADLCEIFMGRVPRQIGEMPMAMGSYERLAAPGQEHLVA